VAGGSLCAFLLDQGVAASMASDFPGRDRARFVMMGWPGAHPFNAPAVGAGRHFQGYVRKRLGKPLPHKEKTVCCLSARSVCKLEAAKSQSDLLPW